MKAAAMNVSGQSSSMPPKRYSSDEVDKRLEQKMTAMKIAGSGASAGEHRHARASDEDRRQLSASVYSAGASALKVTGPSAAEFNARVANPHALTARAVASARADESKRPDSLFEDPLAYRLAGEEGRGLGVSLVIQRTRFMDDFLCAEYAKGTRQVVLLGAGMDARAFRLGLHKMHFFEVDQATIFDVKEPLVADVPLQAASRRWVAAKVEDENLAEKIIAAGFDRNKPSAWVLEGLMMYLNPNQTARMMAQVGRLAAPGSAVVHESLSARYLDSGISYCGARFTGCSDDYDDMWARHAGFDQAEMIDFAGVSVDRSQRMLRIDRHRAQRTKESIRGRVLMYFLTCWKTDGKPR
eukprot:gnl/TRDRNA2_/TRDRNA2_196440_c0_seq1.p1 gnl/TRDRNA2_/TRDRNA2_196440_c0~~gnl/TRDRNA2_/TRDRNA2_196440_c0_seq1.p1  ORF type:complete len:374 (-),score=56.66 gnl/TRDRNA2_/TRDRNA2_196440_c0_seq1:58-1122(-)